MIKYVSASDDQYEEVILSQFGLDRSKCDLKIDNAQSVVEFLNRPKEEIITAISQIDTQGRKVDTNDQLILLLSTLFKHRHFQHDRKVLLKITEIIKSLNDGAVGTQINTFGKLYFILPENSLLKGELLQIYFQTLLSLDGQKDATKEIVDDFKKRIDNYEQEDLNKIISTIAKYIVHTRNYKILEL
jgi:hypothetical protein